MQVHSYPINARVRVPAIDGHLATYHVTYIMQVDTIQSALQGMQTKLAQVQKDIGEQLERYEYLVDDKTERSAMSTLSLIHI